MNIYDFLDSRDIAEYWQKINYKCTPLECAYLIHNSLTATLESRWQAWQEIIDTMPDCVIPERRWLKEQTLHALIKKEITYQQLLWDEFNDESDSVYTFWVDVGGDYCDIGRVFKNKVTCFETIKEYLEDESVIKVGVRKQVIDNHYKEVVTRFNRALQPIDIYGADFNLIDSDVNVIDGGNNFEGFWLSFPTPFKRGDIVIDKWLGGTMVLGSMPTWTSEEMKANGIAGDDEYFKAQDKILAMHQREGDETDMCASGYFYGKEYGFDHDHMENYLHLEYARGELNGENKLLVPLSNYIKGKIDIELLCYAVDLLTKEEEYLALKNNPYFADEGLRLAGIKVEK